MLLTLYWFSLSRQQLKDTEDISLMVNISLLVLAALTVKVKSLKAIKKAEGTMITEGLTHLLGLTDFLNLPISTILLTWPLKQSRHSLSAMQSVSFRSLH